MHRLTVHKRSKIMEREETDKQWLMNFLDKFIPDDFVCKHFHLTFNDDYSATIFLSNKQNEQEEQTE